MATDYMGYKKSGGKLSRELFELIESYKQKGAEAKKANLERYKKGLGIWGDIVGQYQPGGTFGQGAMASFQRSKTRDLAQASQSLVSAGLYNSTIAANLPKKYEEEVGTPFRLNLEDIRNQRLGEARAGMAGFIERREDIPPDPTLLAALLQKGASAGEEGTTTRIFGPSDMFGTRQSSFSGGSGGSGGSGSFGQGGSGGSGSFGQGGSGGGGTRGRGVYSYYDPKTKTGWGAQPIASQQGQASKGAKASIDLSTSEDVIKKLVWDADSNSWVLIQGSNKPPKYGSAEQTIWSSPVTVKTVQKMLSKASSGTHENLQNLPTNVYEDVRNAASGGWL